MSDKYFIRMKETIDTQFLGSCVKMQISGHSYVFYFFFYSIQIYNNKMFLLKLYSFQSVQ